jgi:hypothetical protein
MPFLWRRGHRLGMSDWVKAWDQQRQAELEPVGRDEKSIDELAQLFNLHRDRARDRVNAMIKAGSAEMIYRKAKVSNGQIRKMPYYRLKK